MLLFWTNSANVREICGKLQSSLARSRRSNFFKLDLSLRDTECNGHPDVLDINEHQRTESQVGDFVSEIWGMEKTPVSVEDLGTEEDLGGINPLPVDSP